MRGNTFYIDTYIRTDGRTDARTHTEREKYIPKYVTFRGGHSYKPKDSRTLTLPISREETYSSQKFHNIFCIVANG